MQIATDISTKTLVPIFGVSGCAGFLLRSAKGIKAYNSNDQLIGVFETAGEGIIALLNREI